MSNGAIMNFRKANIKAREKFTSDQFNHPFWKFDLSMGLNMYETSNNKRSKFKKAVKTRR